VFAFTVNSLLSKELKKAGKLNGSVRVIYAATQEDDLLIYSSAVKLHMSVSMKRS